MISIHSCKTRGRTTHAWLCTVAAVGCYCWTSMIGNFLLQQRLSPSSSLLSSFATVAKRSSRSSYIFVNALVQRQPYATVSALGKIINDDNNNNNMINNNNQQSKQKTRVAIIGGGLAGLSCAHHLTSSSRCQLLDVTVFDTGRLRPGGRCASRLPGDAPPQTKNTNNCDTHKGGQSAGNQQFPILSRFTIDHAAQILRVPARRNDVTNSNSANNKNDHNAFIDQVEQWKKQGLVQPFPPQSLFRLKSKSKQLVPVDTTSSSFYFAPQGMGSLPTAIVKESGGKFTVKQDVWVSPSNGVKYLSTSSASNPCWALQSSGQKLGVFDELIIAHNGKCADRLMSQTPAKDIHQLLQVNFRPFVPPNGGNRMTLNSIYSLTVCFKKDNNKSLFSSSSSASAISLPDSFIAAFVEDEGDNKENASLIKFITCQTNKMKQQGDDEYEIWTLLSSADFASKHKGPQEFLPDETIDRVSSLMLDDLERLLGMQPNKPLSLRVVEKRVQLWGAALPLNVWKATDDIAAAAAGGGFLYDPRFHVGVCGDWLVEPSIGGAWRSGKLLADHFLLQQQQQNRGVVVAGLPGSFVRSTAASQSGIGALETEGTGGIRNSGGAPRPTGNRRPVGSNGRGTAATANGGGKRNNNNNSSNYKGGNERRNGNKGSLNTNNNNRSKGSFGSQPGGKREVSVAVSVDTKTTRKE